MTLVGIVFFLLGEEGDLFFFLSSFFPLSKGPQTPRAHHTFFFFSCCLEWETSSFFPPFLVLSELRVSSGNCYCGRNILFFQAVISFPFFPFPDKRCFWCQPPLGGCVRFRRWACTLCLLGRRWRLFPPSPPFSFLLSEAPIFLAAPRRLRPFLCIRLFFSGGR